MPLPDAVNTLASVPLSSAMLSFLGGTAFRLLLSYLMDRYTAYQEHRFQLNEATLQDFLEENTHRRRQEELRLQKDLGIEIIPVEKESAYGVLDEARFDRAVDQVNSPEGTSLSARWNRSIRPFLATVCIALWITAVGMRDFALTPWDLELIAATLGVFVGSRIHHKGS